MKPTVSLTRIRGFASGWSARTVVSSIGEGLVVYDTDLRIVLFNPFMERLTGRTADEMTGKSVPPFDGGAV